MADNIGVGEQTVSHAVSALIKAGYIMVKNEGKREIYPSNTLLPPSNLLPSPSNELPPPLQPVTRGGSNTLLTEGYKEKKLKKEGNPPTPQRGKRLTLNFNFIEDPEWKTVYKEWAQNKKSPYRKQLGLEKGFTHLKNISANDIETARRIIDHSLANNWAGLFVPEDIQDEAEAKRLKEFLDDI